MNRKRLIHELAPILHGARFTARQAGEALGISPGYVARIWRELGLTGQRPRNLAEAMSRLTDDERAKVLSVHNVN